MFFKRKKQESEESKKRSFENLEHLHELERKLEVDIPHEEMARLYFELYNGKWDESAFGAKSEYDNDFYRNVPIRLAEFIKSHIGEKAIERYRYIGLQGHTLDEFEDYWQSMTTTIQKAILW